MWFPFKEVERKYIFPNIFTTSNKNQTTELCPTSSNLNFFGGIFFHFVDVLRSVKQSVISMVRESQKLSRCRRNHQAILFKTRSNGSQ